MKVDVIVPTYNHARYVGDAIESALAQTSPPHELIVVDDGSTDDTAEVVRGFHVRYIRQENAGPAVARNHGLSQSSAEWVVFLDADDRLRPRFIERTTRAARWSSRLGVVYTPAVRVGDSTGVQRVDVWDRHALSLHNYVFMCSLVRRAAIDDAGGFAEELSRLGLEDWDLWLSLAERGWRGKALPEPLFEYRDHSGPRVNSFDTEAVYPVIAARHPWHVASSAPSRPARVWRRLRREAFRLRSARFDHA